MMFLYVILFSLQYVYCITVLVIQSFSTGKTMMDIQFRTLNFRIHKTCSKLKKTKVGKATIANGHSLYILFKFLTLHSISKHCLWKMHKCLNTYPFETYIEFIRELLLCYEDCPGKSKYFSSTSPL